MLGGTCALIGSIVLGPRYKRFKKIDSNTVSVKPAEDLEASMSSRPVIKIPKPKNKKNSKLNNEDIKIENGAIS